MKVKPKVAIETKAVVDRLKEINNCTVIDVAHAAQIGYQRLSDVMYGRIPNGLHDDEQERLFDLLPTMVNTPVIETSSAPEQIEGGWNRRHIYGGLHIAQELSRHFKVSYADILYHCGISIEQLPFPLSKVQDEAIKNLSRHARTHQRLPLLNTPSTLPLPKRPIPHPKLFAFTLAALVCTYLWIGYTLWAR